MIPSVSAIFLCKHLPVWTYAHYHATWNQRNTVLLENVACYWIFPGLQALISACVVNALTLWAISPPHSSFLKECRPYHQLPRWSTIYSCPQSPEYLLIFFIRSYHFPIQRTNDCLSQFGKQQQNNTAFAWPISSTCFLLPPTVSSVILFLTPFKPNWPQVTDA